LGIFLYLGAEVCIARFLKPTIESFGFASYKAALWGPLLFFWTVMFGRLTAGSVNINPRTFLRISAGLGLLGVG
jgi:fucose permease